MFFDYKHHETVLCKLPVWVGTAVLAGLTPARRKYVSLPSKRLGNSNTGVVFLKSRDQCGRSSKCDREGSFVSDPNFSFLGTAGSSEGDSGFSEGH